MPDFSLTFPPDFPDYAWEVEAKGWFAGATLAVGGENYQLTFYDPVRLIQDIESELAAGRVFFFEPNLIVVPSVTRDAMAQAAMSLVESGRLSAFAASPTEQDAADRPLR